ncbi:Uncharacterised protein [Zhongshania aliphaticivorans]|uniref:Nitrogen fixation protein FixH n=1 Tax=Zhongshania aliphaticivorans TaxID=1470434 RepID=A0A5S9NKM9_9GAMM|nr:FixH family protein [Zhongshania aliphaticivorans]CAA0090519.1 Uncharacterised protein [Zhongshania aliphaticivorans]CAA0097990.1 Uncharacterised protein [Zhongshania aliphaticivorans]
MSANNVTQSEPAAAKWYQQFWPWFLIVLPGIVVIASIVTVVIALTHSDNLVRDDYYKEGLAINRYLAQDEAALAMKLVAEGQLSKQGFIQISLRGNSIPLHQHLLLNWQHPTDENLDFQTVLLRDGSHHYSAQVKHDIDSRWYLALSPYDDGEQHQWRLKVEFDAKNSANFIMHSQSSNRETQ